jgi:hypothetical protein
MKRCTIRLKNVHHGSFSHAWGSWAKQKTIGRLNWI